MTGRGDGRAVVALLMAGLADLGGGGGTERFYLDVHAAHARHGSRCRLLLFTDERSLEALESTGRELDSDRVVVLPAAGRLGSLAQSMAVRRACAEHEVSVLHVPLPSPRHLLSLSLASSSRRRRVKRAIGAVDCTFVHALRDRRLRRDPDIRRAYWLYRLFPAAVRVDGVYTWYRLFAERAAEWWPRGQPVVRCAACVFVDTERYLPAEQKCPEIVFAARLVRSKQPLLFVDAVAEALRTDAPAFADWRFRMFGRGPLEQAVRRRIDQQGLGERLSLEACPDLREPLSRSQVFVSTQDFENFSSLSVLEAMACANAIVARDVGQTQEIVRPGRNGWLSDSDDPASIAACMLEAVSDTRRLAAFGNDSRRITLEEQCVQRFISDIEDFWSDVLAAPAA